MGGGCQRDLDHAGNVVDRPPLETLSMSNAYVHSRASSVSFSSGFKGLQEH